MDFGFWILDSWDFGFGFWTLDLGFYRLLATQGGLTLLFYNALAIASLFLYITQTKTLALAWATNCTHDMILVLEQLKSLPSRAIG